MATLIPGAKIAGMEPIRFHGSAGGFSIAVVARSDGAGECGRNHNFALTFPRSQNLAVLTNQPDIEIRQWSPHRSDNVFVIIGSQRRTFGHAITFADLNAEPFLKCSPNGRRTAATPCNARIVIPVVGTFRLLEQNLDNAAQVMNVGATGFANLFPELRAAETFNHRQGYVVEQREKDHLGAADMVEWLPHEKFVARLHIRAKRNRVASELQHHMGDHY